MDIEERTINIGHYIIDKKATVRAAAKYFGVSKSTVHTGRVTLKVFISKLPKQCGLLRSKIFQIGLYKI